MSDLDRLIQDTPHAAEAASALASLMPSGLSVTAHSDQSTDDYPDLEAQPLDNTLFAKNCVAALLNNGFKLEKA